MSISSIAGTALGSLLNVAPNSKSGHGNFQQIQSEFQQLGKDLQAGNLTQAQQDYATLWQNFSNAQTSTAAATANNSNPVAQAFTALSQDLQNSNISAAQKDNANIQQDFQQQRGTSLALRSTAIQQSLQRPNRLRHPATRPAAIHRVRHLNFNQRQHAILRTNVKRHAERHRMDCSRKLSSASVNSVQIGISSFTV
jgi:hypothetical protein